MKTYLTNLTIALSLIACLFTWSCGGTQTVTTDEKPGPVVSEASPGTITFNAANDRYSAEGTFKKWSFSSFNMKKNEVSSINATVSIDLTSVWEKSDGLTQHLKAPDYFHVEKYTTATIDISDVTAFGRDVYKAKMVLAMKGVKQELEAQFKVNSTTPMKITGEAVVDRNIFNVGEGNEKVPKDITVKFDAVLPQ